MTSSTCHYYAKVTLDPATRLIGIVPLTHRGFVLACCETSSWIPFNLVLFGIVSFVSSIFFIVTILSVKRTRPSNFAIMRCT